MRASSAAPSRPREASVTGACRLTKSLAREQLVERDRLGARADRALGREPRVVHEQTRAEGQQPLGDLAADRAEPDQADRLAPELAAAERA